MIIDHYEQAISADLMALLLSADPDQTVLETYIFDASILVCRDKKQLLAVAVLTQQDNVFELKNIAVLASQQGKGIAKLLIEEVKQLATARGALQLEIGTGNSSLAQLGLYQKCGFRMYRIECNFFANYPEPIFENGIRCIDKVCLRAAL